MPFTESLRAIIADMPRHGDTILAQKNGKPFAYQTIWVVAITYLAWFWLIRHYPAPKIASFTFFTPIFGVFAGWLILDEPLTIALLVALALVATGVWLVNRQETGNG